MTKSRYVGKAFVASFLRCERTQGDCRGLRMPCVSCRGGRSRGIEKRIAASGQAPLHIL
jgi:hypothetical protein